MTKREIRFYTVADYLEEEQWLRDQHRNGWKITRMTPPCFYYFESCEPKDVIYRLDYRNDVVEDETYLQMLKDFGWEYFGKCFGWHYFRKDADAIESKEEGELFSDDASRVDLISAIVKTRMIPLAIIFLCCVIPNFWRFLSGEFTGPWGTFIGIFFAFMFCVYVYLISHCGSKLKMLKDKYQH